MPATSATAAGLPFRRAAGADAAGLLVVTGIPADLFADARGPALVRRALATAATWRAGDGRPAIGEIGVDRDGIVLYTAPGAVAVRLGRGNPETEQAAMRRFDLVWGALAPAERLSAQTIYLDSRTRPDRVVVALGKAASNPHTSE